MKQITQQNIDHTCHEILMAIKNKCKGEELTQEDLTRFNEAVDDFAIDCESYNTGERKEIVQKILPDTKIDEIAEKVQGQTFREFRKTLPKIVTPYLLEIHDAMKDAEIRNLPKENEELELVEVEQGIYQFNVRTSYELWKLIEDYFVWDDKHDGWTCTEENAKIISEKYKILANGGITIAKIDEIKKMETKVEQILEDITEYIMTEPVDKYNAIQFRFG